MIMLPEGTMSTEEKMTIDERRKYLRKMQARYRQAGRKERGHLLDEMEAITELHRNSLLRLMQGRLERIPRQQQRGRPYTPQADDALRVIAESFDYICPERLTPNLPWMAQHLATHGELSLGPPLLGELDRISVSTVRRILSRLGQAKPRLPRPGPQQTRHLTRTLPMKRIPWNQSQPGYFEADLVYHSGPDPSGQYVHTLQMVDV